MGRPPGAVSRVGKLAEVLPYSPKTIRGYLARGWDGDPATLEDWRAENLRKRGSSGPLPRMDRKTVDEVAPDEGEGGKDWASEYRRVKTLQAVVQLKAAQGELIRRDEVERLFVLRVAEVRAGLLRLPRQLARRLANQSADVIEEELEAEVRKLLEHYSRGDPVLEGRPRKRGKGRRTG